MSSFSKGLRTRCTYLRDGTGYSGVCSFQRTALQLGSTAADSGSEAVHFTVTVSVTADVTAESGSSNCNG